MIRTLLASVIVVGVGLAGCGNKDEKSAKTELPSKNKPQSKPATPVAAKPKAPPKPMVPDRTADVTKAAALWAEAGAGYHKWKAHSKAPVSGKSPHGAFIQTYYNGVAGKALSAAGPWPDGSILAKDNYMPNAAKSGPGKLAAVTFMKKQGGKWFWVKYKPDGSVAKTPPNHPKMPNMSLAGTDKLRCIGCHKNKQTRDFVITDLARK